MRYIIIFLLLLFSSRVLGQRNNTKGMHNAEFTLGIGTVIAEPKGQTGWNNYFEKLIWARPKPGPKFSAGINFNFNRYGRSIYMSLGARLMHCAFSTEERILRYRWDHHSLPSYYREEDYSFKYNFTSMGIPIRLNYKTSIGNRQKLLAGIGVFPCLQSGLKKNPFAAYTEAYAGCLLNQRIALTLDAHRSFFTYPKSDLLGITGTYSSWGIMLEMRYCFKVN